MTSLTPSPLNESSTSIRPHRRDGLGYVYEIAAGVIFGFLILAAPGALILRILGFQKDSPINWFFAVCLGLIFFAVFKLYFGVEWLIITILFSPIIAFVAIHTYSIIVGIYHWVLRVVGRS